MFTSTALTFQQLVPFAMLSVRHKKTGRPVQDKMLNRLATKMSTAWNTSTLPSSSTSNFLPSGQVGSHEPVGAPILKSPWLQDKHCDGDGAVQLSQVESQALHSWLAASSKKPLGQEALHSPLCRNNLWLSLAAHSVQALALPSLQFLQDGWQEWHSPSASTYFPSPHFFTHRPGTCLYSDVHEVQAVALPAHVRHEKSHFAQIKTESCTCVNVPSGQRFTQLPLCNISGGLQERQSDVLGPWQVAHVRLHDLQSFPATSWYSDLEQSATHSYSWKKHILLLKASHLQTVEADWKVISDFPNTVGAITKTSSPLTSFTRLFVVNLQGYKAQTVRKYDTFISATEICSRKKFILLTRFR